MAAIQPHRAPIPSSPRRPMNIMTDTHLNEQPRQDSSRDSGIHLGGQPHLAGYGPSSSGYPKVVPNAAVEMRSPQLGSMRPPIRSTASQDAQMDDENEDDVEESENESITSDTNRPSKKKKGQRFFCTDWPPCALSFTRSEHLARHIRKHTGERPFQCHCLRRFSRLDNLRQHAQTVHVNEDIPGDSLAATGTRFQRQIRTDRVRPPGSRSRAATLNSQSSHGRGHSRNLSGSSIGSVASEMPLYEEYRRRPMPLAMAQNHTPRIPLTLDTSGATNTNPQPYDPQYYNYSSGFTTPTSVFSATSPGASSGQSPMFAFPHAPPSQRGYHNRRLSVPVAPNPFQPPGQSRPNTISYMTPLQSSTASTFSESGTMNSPTSPAYHMARAEAAAAEADLRRRTWHPGTYAGYGPRPATSGLANYQTPDAPEPVATAQPAAAQAIRLPGIDSFFDRSHAHSMSLPRNPASPMDVEQSQRLKHPREIAASDTSSRPDSWDVMSHNLHQLNIATPPREKAVPRSVTFSAPPPVMGRFVTSTSGTQPVLQHAQVRQPVLSSDEPEVKLADPPLTPRRAKRQGWYKGPVGPTVDTQPTFPQLRRSPGATDSDGLQTRATHINEYRPAIMHSNGYVEPHPTAVPIDDARKAYTLAARQHHQHQPPLQPLAPRSPRPVVKGASNTDRLDALVAVATSGGQLGMPTHNRPV